MASVYDSCTPTRDHAKNKQLGMRSQICDALPPATPGTTVVCILMSNVMLHAQRSAEVSVTARDTGQAIFKCPEHVPARAATSLTQTQGIGSLTCF
eukprot:6194153-Pleurochrysis_carterae.AAC.6